jgi:hypothetical protein
MYSFGSGFFDRPPVSGADIRYRSLYRLHADDLVMSRLNGWEGAVAVVGEGFQGSFVSAEYPTFSVDASKVLPSYLAQLCRWPAFWDALLDRARGVGSNMGVRRLRVHPADLLMIEVPVPDIDEQCRVTSYVETLLRGMTDIAARRGVQRRILGELPWAVLASAFEDLMRRWGASPLESVVHINPEPWNPADCSAPKFAYVDIGSVEKGRGRITGAVELPVTEAPQRARRLMRAGDVVMSTVRPNLRGTALVPEDLDGAVCSTGFAVLRPVSLRPDFLLMQLLSPTVVDQLAIDAHGGHYPAVTDARLRQTSIVVPPLDLQEGIVRRLRALLDRAWRGAALDGRAASLARAIPPSVLNAAFEGTLQRVHG